MAWLDDSPGSESRKESAIALTSGFSRNTNTGKLRIYQFPFFKIFYNWYHDLSLLRILYKKLNAIEKKILLGCFEEVGNVTSLLRELMQAKKLSSDSNQTSFKRLAQKIHARSEHLKRSLIKTSHQFITECHFPEIGFKQPTINSHHYVLSMCNKKEVPKLQASKIPERLHWRYASNDSSANSYGESAYKSKNSSLIYLHTSFHHLFELLSNKFNIISLHKSSKIKVCDKGFNFKHEGNLVCGLSLKLSQNNISKNEESLQKATFWQQQPASGFLDLLGKITHSNIKDYLKEIFFQSSANFQDFKTLLHLKQEKDLLDLLTVMEAKRLVIINEDHREKADYSSPANKLV